MRGSPRTKPWISKRTAAQQPFSIAPFMCTMRSGAAHFSYVDSYFSISTPSASAISGIVWPHENTRIFVFSSSAFSSSGRPIPMVRA